MTIKISISYDGSSYFGSQIQPHANTVELQITKALRKINISSKPIFAGRTDTGVHATNQIISIDLQNNTHWNDLSKLKLALQKGLPNDIQVKKLSQVKDDFHPRFHANTRSYRYIISTDNPNPFFSNYITYTNNIDFKLIQEALNMLIGEHNFVYFSKTGSKPKSTIRSVYFAKIYKYQDNFVIYIKANSFLRGQIRMIMSFLLKISDKKLTIEDFEEQLNAKQRISWTLAPASGLYLTNTSY